LPYEVDPLTDLKNKEKYDLITPELNQFGYFGVMGSSSNLGITRFEIG